MVELIADVPLPRGFKKPFKLRVKAIAIAVGVANKRVNVLLTSDEELKRLNKAYRGKNKSTDVLSFPAEVDDFPMPGTKKLLGDIAISLPQAIKQAADNNNDLLDELTLLFTHGLCHLIGLDHQTAEQETLMEAKVKALVSLVGCDTYTNYGH